MEFKAFSLRYLISIQRISNSQSNFDCEMFSWEFCILCALWIYRCEKLHFNHSWIYSIPFVDSPLFGQYVLRVKLIFNIKSLVLYRNFSFSKCILQNGIGHVNLDGYTKSDFKIPRKWFVYIFNRDLQRKNAST